MGTLGNTALLSYTLFRGGNVRLKYRGPWNAQANVPPLRSYRGVRNTYYVVAVAGNTELNGIREWQVGDWVVFDGQVWTRVPGNGQVPGVPEGGTGASAGVRSYTHRQSEPARIWQVQHNLGRRPQVVTVIRQSDNAVVYAAIIHETENALRVEFSEPLAGFAECWVNTNSAGGN